MLFKWHNPENYGILFHSNDSFCLYESINIISFIDSSNFSFLSSNLDFQQKMRNQSN